MNRDDKLLAVPFTAFCGMCKLKPLIVRIANGDSPVFFALEQCVHTSHKVSLKSQITSIDLC